jgi:hypothetical protein
MFLRLISMPFEKNMQGSVECILRKGTQNRNYVVSDAERRSDYKVLKWFVKRDGIMDEIEISKNK